MQVKEENGQLFCLKHQQIIQLIVMDDNAPPQDQMLCLMCMSLCKQQYKQVVKVEQAKKIIKEKLILSDEENKLQQLINKLINHQSNMIELIQQLSKNIETITRMIDYLKIKLNNNDVISLVKGLELLKLKNSETKILKSDQSEQSSQLNKSQESFELEMSNVQIKMINTIQQDEDCGAIAFDVFGSIMISGAKMKLKFGNSTRAKLRKQAIQQKLKIVQLHCYSVKINNGLYLVMIVEILNVGKKDKLYLNGQDEDYLLSCSDDNTIIIWKADYQNNILEYQYLLENKHTLFVNGLSLNFSDTSLVSCGEDKQLILRQRGQDNKWIYKSSIFLEKPLIRVGFVDLNQFLVQQDGSGFTNVFEVNNQELIEKKNLKIELNNKNEYADYDCFPTIYNKNQSIIIQKSNQFVYILKKHNGQFKIAAPIIDCNVDENHGALTMDGEFLVIWNEQTKEFRVYQISK